MAEAVTPASSSVQLGPGQRVTAGDIAARIDRLPLTRTQYGYSAITQWFWGIMIAADGLVAVLYPFVWAPKGQITSFQFDVILGANIGVGILIGEYAGGFLSDMIGRKWTLILAALVEGLFIWPIALTHAFGWLLLWNLLFALGMGMLLSVHAVYIHELAPPQHRQRLSLRCQAIGSDHDAPEPLGDCRVPVLSAGQRQPVNAGSDVASGDPLAWTKLDR